MLGGFDPSNYKSEYVHATASDGTKIPVSIVYRAGTALDGTAPLLQYSYGSYGSSTEPYFRKNVIGGPGAFLLTADSFQDYARAIRLKLLREILVPLADGSGRQLTSVCCDDRTPDGSSLRQ